MQLQNYERVHGCGIPICWGYESFSGGLEKSAIFAMLMPHLKVGAQKWTATTSVKSYYKDAVQEINRQTNKQTNQQTWIEREYNKGCIQTGKLKLKRGWLEENRTIYCYCRLSDSEDPIPIEIMNKIRFQMYTVSWTVFLILYFTWKISGKGNDFSFS